jgi:hypothetical protein
MTSGDAVASIHITGLKAAEKQDLAAAEKEEMNGDREFYVHGYPSSVGSRTELSGRAPKGAPSVEDYRLSIHFGIQPFSEESNGAVNLFRVCDAPG